MHSWGGPRRGAAGVGDREEPHKGPSSSRVRRGLCVALSLMQIPTRFT